MPEFGSQRLQVKLTEELRRSQQNLADLQQELQTEGRLFEDEEFPASWSSLTAELRDILEEPQLLCWKRPKEICDNPKFVSDGTSRFDVRQGMLGDCWLLAAVASLSMHPQLFNRVVPQPQEFDGSGYSGMFRFRFWQFGEWTDVFVDDRLPTYENELVFMHSTDSSEFWSALLEKAYAKMMGGYAALKGGSTTEAMEDFTGGISESFDLGQCPPGLFEVMLKAGRCSSLMGCGINADPSQLEARLDNGLIMGHAYSVTGVEKVRLADGSEQRLVRVRNPWGNEEEWRGAWSDGADDWSLVEAEELRRLQVADRDDGEFWMSFADFAANFHKLEICSLGPDSADEGEAGRQRWRATQHHGRWVRGVSAGGCRKFLDTFCRNPQFRLRVVDADENDEEELGTVVVGLMQKDRRRMRAENRYIGYMLYKLPGTAPSGPAPKEFFKFTASAGRSPGFADSREVTGRHRLPPADYVLVPSTFDPNEEAEFLVRVYSEQPNQSEECDEASQIPEIEETADATPEAKPLPAAERRRLEEAAATAFAVLQGDQCGLSADDLMSLVNAAFAKIGPPSFKGFSKEACRSLLAFVDANQSGYLEFQELQTLWKFLRMLSAVFKAYDTDGSGDFSSFELRDALGCIGYHVTNGVFRAVALRYAAKDGGIGFDDFVIICVRLQTIFQEFKSKAASSEGSVAYGLDEFLQVAAYT